VLKDAEFGITEEEAYLELQIRIKRPPREYRNPNTIMNGYPYCLDNKLGLNFIKQNEKLLTDYDESIKRIREIFIELFNRLEYVSWV
jgi:hypothetical protein